MMEYFPWNQRECNICYESYPMVTYACGHEACARCTDGLLEFSEPRCHLCRRSISYLRAVDSFFTVILLLSGMTIFFVLYQINLLFFREDL